MFIERHIGARIKERRVMLGYTPQDFAAKLGCVPSRVRTIENGRLFAVEVFEVARVLRVPVSYFYDGLNGEKLPPLAQNERWRLELSRNFSMLAEPQQRALHVYVKTLVEEG